MTPNEVVIVGKIKEADAYDALRYFTEYPLASDSTYVTPDDSTYVTPDDSTYVTPALNYLGLLDIAQENE